MEYEVTRQPGCIAEIHVSYTAEDVNKYFGMAYDRLRNDARIPGFRPGKAPNVIIRKRVGEDAVRDSAWLQLIEKSVEKILEAADLKTYDEPTLKDMEKGSEGLAEGEAYELELVTTLPPEVALGETRGLKLVKPDTEVTEEEIAKTLAELQETHAVVGEVERDVVAEGDLVKARVITTVEGDDEPYEEADQEIVVGAGKYQPEIDREMIGKQVGSEVEMEYTYPEDYADVALAGAKTTVKATINSLKERTLPTLDDEFAKVVDEEYATLDDLKARIREQAARVHEAFAKEQLELQAFKQVFDSSTIDIPAAMVENVARGKIEDFERDLIRDGMDLQTLQEVAGISKARLLDRERLVAAEGVRVHFLYEKLIEAEGIEPTEEDINAAITDYAKETHTDEAFLRQAAAVQEDFTERMTERAARILALKALVDNAEIETVSREEYESREEEIFAHVHGPNCGHIVDEEYEGEQAGESADETDLCTEDHEHGPECIHAAEAEATSEAEPAVVAETAAEAAVESEPNADESAEETAE